MRTGALTPDRIETLQLADCLMLNGRPHLLCFGEDCFLVCQVFLEDCSINEQIEFTADEKHAWPETFES